MYNVYMCVYIYIYMFTERERERQRERERDIACARRRPGSDPGAPKKFKRSSDRSREAARTPSLTGTSGLPPRPL